MELRLKDDIITESEDHFGNIIIHSEINYKEIQSMAASVTSSNVLTPHQAFQILSIEGYNVDYTRLPITSEEIPDYSTYDRLLNKLKDISGDTIVIFNCQTGYFRSSHMMVIATSIQYWRSKNNKLIPSIIPGFIIESGNCEEAEIGGIRV